MSHHGLRDSGLVEQSINPVVMKMFGIYVSCFEYARSEGSGYTIRRHMLARAFAAHQFFAIHKGHCFWHYF